MWHFEQVGEKYGYRLWLICFQGRGHSRFSNRPYLKALSDKMVLKALSILRLKEIASKMKAHVPFQRLPKSINNAELPYA